MKNGHGKGTAPLTVMLVLLATVGGCRRGAPTPESDYTGAWAQVPDVLAHIGEPGIPDRDFNIMAFEAVADGVTDCRPAIMAAIQACEDAGGGRVVVPAGTYLVNGPLYLVNDMNLHLAEGAHVKFGTKYDDYLPVVLTRWRGTQIYNYCPFLYAYRRTNVAVTGTGTLDGQAKGTWSTWTAKEDKGAETARRLNAEGTSVVDRFLGDGYFLRPSMIAFLGCENVLVEGVTIVDSPFWCLHPIFSKNVTIRNVRIESDNPDNDGVALDSCGYVHVHGVTFANRGAGVAVKSGHGREGRELGWPSRNIYIQDCTFDTETAIAIDKGVAGGVYNVFVENCGAASGLQPTLAIAAGPPADGEVAHVWHRHLTFVETPEETNRPPHVYAGPDIQLDERGGTVTLKGSVGGDGVPSYAWSVIQGDADAVTIANPSALTTQATFSQSGVYILKLEASDGEAVGFHFLMVKVGEQPDGMGDVAKPIFASGQ